MSKPNVIEQVKNVALVVLFLSTVLLLYFFWGSDSYREVSEPDQKVQGESVLAKELVRPEKIIVNFGEDNYTVIASENSWIWNDSKNSILSGLDRFGKAENILAEEITDKQYQEVMKYRSICAEFSYNIPMNDFCSIFGLNQPQSYDMIKTVTAIGYSTYSPERIFIYDGKNMKYYMLMAQEADTGLDNLITSIESKGYDPYYPVGSFIGIGVENTTLIPISLESNLQSFLYQQDAYIHQTDKINYLAEKFFGENFDFVRKITENNGTIIYMYGYGQKVLIVNTDGSFEYKEEQINDSSDLGFYDSLTTAIQFIESHGTWESLEGTRITRYLRNVTENPDQKEGYRFTFDLEINGSPVYYEKGDAFVIDVENGQVNYFKRNMIDYNQNDVDATEAASYENAFSAVNLIAKNYEYIDDLLKEQGVVTEDGLIPGSFEDISALITDMKTGYMKTTSAAGENKMIPVWVVTIKNIDFYFGLYDAEPEGFSISERG